MAKEGQRGANSQIRLAQVGKDTQKEYGVGIQVHDLHSIKLQHLNKKEEWREGQPALQEVHKDHRLVGVRRREGLA